MGWTTVQLRGGLGNQLFQYAAGRAVAERTNTRLRLDACYFGVEFQRNYELGNFHIRAKVIHEPAGSARYMDNEPLEDAWVRGRFGAETVREPHYHYSDALDHAPPNSYLTGYWQCARNFESVTERLRRELRPKRLGSRARRLRREIKQTGQSVAVHVRRDDIANDAGINRLVGTMPLDYYDRAAAAILDQRENPNFFVFSDEPEWCAEHLKLPGPTRIVSGSTGPVEDLALISACDDAIIANSSFSWWGAWLGETEHSIIVAPEKWYDEHWHDTSDVRPSHWIAL